MFGKTEYLFLSIDNANDEVSVLKLTMEFKIIIVALFFHAN